MFPILNIDDAQYQIESVSYHEGLMTFAMVDSNGEKIFYWNKNMNIGDRPVDFEKTIHWQGRYEPIIEVIDDAISLYENELTVLSKKIAEQFVTTGYVPNELKNQYKQLVFNASGAKHIRNLVHGMTENKAPTNYREKDESNEL